MNRPTHIWSLKKTVSHRNLCSYNIRHKSSPIKILPNKTRLSNPNYDPLTNFIVGFFFFLV